MSPVRDDPPQGGPNKMAGQVKGIAIANIVFGVLDVLVALFVIIGLGIAGGAVRANRDYGAPGWVADMLGSLAIVLGLLILAVAAVHILAGIRLLNFQRSGKVLGIVSAVVLLVTNLPAAFGGIGLIGVGIAIWMFVVLTRPDTDRLLVN